jgi:hypothetical protein
VRDLHWHWHLPFPTSEISNLKFEISDVFQNGLAYGWTFSATSLGAEGVS